MNVFNSWVFAFVDHSHSESVTVPPVHGPQGRYAETAESFEKHPGGKATVAWYEL